MRKTLQFLAVFTLLIILIGSCGKKPGPGNQQIQGNQQQIQGNNIQPQVVLKQQLYDTISSGVQTSLNAIEFLTVPRGIAVGDSGKILLTKTGGHSWRSVGAGLPPVNLHGVSIVDSITYVAVGDYGSIFRTIDSAHTWDTAQSLFSFQNLKAVAFDNKYLGYAVGDSGVIFRSSNGGANWIKVHGDPSQTLNAISFNLNNIPYITGNNGLILNSNDYGVHWDSIHILTTENLNSIHFSQVNFHIHTDNGFAVGDHGVILTTTDGGVTWDTVTHVTTENLRGVFISAPHWGYAVGDNGTVIRYNGHWKLLPKPTNNRINAVDPGATWSPSPILVFADEHGWIFISYAPPVNDGQNSSSDCYNNGKSSTVTVIPCTSPGCCTFNFNLTTNDLNGSDDFGNPVMFESFRVCSSMELSYFFGPTVGWARNERYFSNSVPIAACNTYTEDNLSPLTFIPDPSNPVGYMSCYLMGNDGNPYLLSSGEITCSP